MKAYVWEINRDSYIPGVCISIARSVVEARLLAKAELTDYRYKEIKDQLPVISILPACFSHDGGD